MGLSDGSVGSEEIAEDGGNISNGRRVVAWSCSSKYLGSMVLRIWVIRIFSTIVHSLKRKNASSWTACAAAICGPVPFAGGAKRPGATFCVYM